MEQFGLKIRYINRTESFYTYYSISILNKITNIPEIDIELICNTRSLNFLKSLLAEGYTNYSQLGFFISKDNDVLRIHTSYPEKEEKHFSVPLDICFIKDLIRRFEIEMSYNYAVASRWLETEEDNVEEFFQSVANVDIRCNFSHWSLLHYAVVKERVKSVKILLSRIEIDVSATCCMGETIVEPASFRNYDILKLLVNDERVDFEHHVFSTCLENALFHQKYDNFFLLLTRVPITLCNNDGKTLLDTCLENQDLVSIRWLRDQNLIQNFTNSNEALKLLN